MVYGLIFLGGGLGAVFRFLLSVTVGSQVRGYQTYQTMAGGHLFRYWLDNLPLATLCANWLGAFFIGVVIEFLALKFSGQRVMGDIIRYFLVTGFLGGFTTFSAFSLESYNLMVRGQYGILALYILLSVLGTIGLVWLAIHLLRLVF